MAVMYGQSRTTVYYHMSTTNKSFLEVSQYLKDSGIMNHKFMLVLIDPDLARIDPHDPGLSTMMKTKVLKECLYNPWYFFRETVRIPDSGQTTGVKFQLNRGNLALLFCLMLNLNIFLEQPRQTGKTISSLCWYLYLFNFGTANAENALLSGKGITAIIEGGFHNLNGANLAIGTARYDSATQKGVLIKTGTAISSVFASNENITVENGNAEVAKWFDSDSNFIAMGYYNSAKDAKLDASVLPIVINDEKNYNLKYTSWIGAPDENGA